MYEGRRLGQLTTLLRRSAELGLAGSRADEAAELGGALLSEPGVAAGVAGLPAEAASEPSDRFALVNVHAWSFRDSGGPMGAIAKTIPLLPPGTRVVTAGEFFRLLTP